jgi:GDPmannose 4,6-dehydratase
MRVLITGIAGQDGSYLADLLLAQGHEVHGLVRTHHPEKLQRIAHALEEIRLHEASLEDYEGVARVVHQVEPEECYHLAAQSVVVQTTVAREGFDRVTLEANVTGTHHMLAALHERAPGCRFHFAGSSEVFGRVEDFPQNERTPFRPRTLYGISKVTGLLLTRLYREQHGMHASASILFNHESPRRGANFVTRKITLGVARIRAGLDTELRLGRLDARRDWGHARDYVEGMTRIVRHSAADDFVLATGETHTVAEFCDLAFSAASLDYRDYVVEDPRFARPAERVPSCGDASKARALLGWTPTTSFQDLAKEMAFADLAADI